MLLDRLPDTSSPLVRRTLSCRGSLFVIFAILFIGINASGCAQGGSDGDSSSSDGSVDSVDGEIVDSGPGVAFGSRCGAVVNGSLQNPVPSQNLERVSVEVISPNQVVVTRQEGIDAGGQQLIKLHGVSTEGIRDFLIPRATGTFQDVVGTDAFLAEVGAEPVAGTIEGEEAVSRPCEIVFPGGGVGTAGQLFTPDGRNVTEQLLELGTLRPDPTDGCGSELLTGCYDSIEPIQMFSDRVVSSFLWKPVAERDGNLVVLVDEFNLTVVVEGAISTTLVDFGPSNGRGTTARANVPGSAFGSNITVRFFDEEGLPVLLRNGNETVTVPNGAQRLETTF